MESARGVPRNCSVQPPFLAVVVPAESQIPLSLLALGWIGAVKLTIEATGTIERAAITTARRWEGVTETGIPVACWITLVKAKDPEQQGLIDLEINEVRR